MDPRLIGLIAFVKYRAVKSESLRLTSRAASLTLDSILPNGDFTALGAGKLGTEASSVQLEQLEASTSHSNNDFSDESLSKYATTASVTKPPTASAALHPSSPSRQHRDSIRIHVIPQSPRHTQPLRETNDEPAPHPKHQTGTPRTKQSQLDRLGHRDYSTSALASPDRVLILSRQPSCQQRQRSRHAHKHAKLSLVDFGLTQSPTHHHFPPRPSRLNSSQVTQC